VLDKLAALSPDNESAYERCVDALKSVDKALEIFPTFGPALNLGRALTRSLSFIAAAIEAPSNSPLFYKEKSLEFAKKALEAPGGNAKSENFLYAGNAEVDLAQADPENQLPHLQVCNCTCTCLSHVIILMNID
jgi:hypothetical protein